MDGFNLYNGLKANGWKRFYWLDIPKLVRSILKTHQTLVATNYYTSRVSRPTDKAERQGAFLNALQTLPGLRISLGMLQLRPRMCTHCRLENWAPVEKMTDVNIAVDLLVDAVDDRFDVAILITADTDLVNAVRTVRERYPTKAVSVLFPPSRHSGELAAAASGSMTIGRAKFNQSQLPDVVVDASGREYRRPTEWSSANRPA